MISSKAALLEVSLDLSVDDNVARGLYTYVGNPLYNPQSKENMSDVSDVSGSSNVSDMSESQNGHETDNVRNGNGYKPTSQAHLQETDISDMDSYVGTKGLGKRCHICKRNEAVVWWPGDVPRCEECSKQVSA